MAPCAEVGGKSCFYFIAHPSHVEHSEVLFCEPVESNLQVYKPGLLGFRGEVVRSQKCFASNFSPSPYWRGSLLTRPLLHSACLRFNVRILFLIFITGVTNRYFSVWMRCFVAINIYYLRQGKLKCLKIITFPSCKHFVENLGSVGKIEITRNPINPEATIANSFFFFFRYFFPKLCCFQI